MLNISKKVLNRKEGEGAEDSDLKKGRVSVFSLGLV